MGNKYIFTGAGSSTGQRLIVARWQQPDQKIYGAVVYSSFVFFQMGNENGITRPGSVPAAVVAQAKRRQSTPRPAY